LQVDDAFLGVEERSHGPHVDGRPSFRLVQ
jgi:hypothetical protein